MFSKAFYKTVLNLFVKEETFSDCIGLIKEGFFGENENYFNWFRRIKRVIKKYGLINSEIFIEEYGEKAKKLLEHNYEKIEVYVRKNLRKFIFLSTLQTYATEKLTREFEKEFNEIDEAEIKNGLERVLESWIEEGNKGGLDYYDDINKRILTLDYRSGVPTGWYGIDSHLMGDGLCPGELGIILALPNTGKSASLVNLAITAATFGKSVLYVTLEMAKEIVAHRLDMRLTGFTTSEVFENLSEVSRRIRKFQKVTRNKIYIQEYRSESATVRDLEKFIKKEVGPGKRNFDFLVVDYADILTPRSKYAREDLAYREIYTDLRQLGSKYSLPIWTASQSGRGKLEEGKALDMTNFADAFAKGFITDVVISINQNKKQEDAGEAYYYLAKNRNASARRGCVLKTDWDRMLVVDQSDYDIFYNKKN